MSVPEVESQFFKIRDSDPRLAAELAYVLARLYLTDGDNEKATSFGRESIRLFDLCKMETLEDCAAHLVAIEGVALPSLIHQAVVRDRLKGLKI